VGQRGSHGRRRRSIVGVFVLVRAFPPVYIAVAICE
jgi:hypothetical protein